MAEKKTIELSEHPCRQDLLNKISDAILAYVEEHQVRRGPSGGVVISDLTIQEILYVNGILMGYWIQLGLNVNMDLDDIGLVVQAGIQVGRREAATEGVAVPVPATGEEAQSACAADDQTEHGSTALPKKILLN